MDAELRIVEVVRGFAVGAFEVKPGARVWAWKAREGWRVVFNGADIPVPDGTVRELEGAK